MKARPNSRKSFSLMRAIFCGPAMAGTLCLASVALAQSGAQRSSLAVTATVVTVCTVSSREGSAPVCANALADQPTASTSHSAERTDLTEAPTRAYPSGLIRSEAEGDVKRVTVTF